jgi:hypothetical protein
MKYLVEFTQRAVNYLIDLYLEKNAVGSTAAAKWFNRLERLCTDWMFTLNAVLSQQRRRKQAGYSGICFTARSLISTGRVRDQRIRKLVFIFTIRHGAMERAEFL